MVSGGTVDISVSSVTGGGGGRGEVDCRNASTGMSIKRKRPPKTK
jgi:hypothetical protein